MNERIKALYLLAKLGKGADNMEVEPWIDDFAQMIIDDCLDFVGNTHNSGDIDDLALGAAADGINEHFGRPVA